MSYELNPDCGDMCEHYGLNSTEFNNIVHVQGSNDDDTLHFIWSTVGAPTVLIAKTDKNVTMEIDWKTLFSPDPSHALKFTGKVYYSFAAIMSMVLFNFLNNDTYIYTMLILLHFLWIILWRE